MTILPMTVSPAERRRAQEFALLLEASAVVAGMNDPATAPSVALRRETLRERAASDPSAPPELNRLLSR